MALIDRFLRSDYATEQSRRTVALTDTCGSLEAGVHHTAMPHMAITYIVPQDEAPEMVTTGADYPEGYLVTAFLRNINDPAGDMSVVLPNAADLNASHPLVGPGDAFTLYYCQDTFKSLRFKNSLDLTVVLDGSGVTSLKAHETCQMTFWRTLDGQFWTVRCTQ